MRAAAAAVTVSLVMGSLVILFGCCSGVQVRVSPPPLEGSRVQSGAIG